MFTLTRIYSPESIYTDVMVGPESLLHVLHSWAQQPNFNVWASKLIYKTTSSCTPIRISHFRPKAPRIFGRFKTLKIPMAGRHNHGHRQPLIYQYRVTRSLLVVELFRRSSAAALQRRSEGCSSTALGSGFQCWVWRCVSRQCSGVSCRRRSLLETAKQPAQAPQLRPRACDLQTRRSTTSCTSSVSQIHRL